MATNKKVKVTLTKSISGRLKKHQACVKGLGLRGKIRQSAIIEDTPAVRGMINKVNYLLKVEDV